MKHWEFNTFIFEPDRKKTNRQLAFDVLKTALLIGVIFVSIFNPWILFAIVFLALKLGYNTELYEKSLKRTYKDYGRKGLPITITDKSILVKNQSIDFDDIDAMVIYVDEYAGMSKHIFWKHHGGNNEIRFSKNGKITSILYYIASKGDFHYLEHLVAQIEKKHPPVELQIPVKDL